MPEERQALASRGNAQGTDICPTWIHLARFCCSCFVSTHEVCCILHMLYTIVRQELSSAPWQTRRMQGTA